MKILQRFTSLALCTAMATVLFGTVPVTAENPSEISYDFTTQEGVEASGQAAAVHFVPEKQAATFDGAFGPVFAHTDPQNNVRITEMEFEYNTTGGLSLQVRSDTANTVLGNPLAVADDQDIEFMYWDSAIHGLTVEDGHRYRFTYVYDYATGYLTGLAWDLTNGEDELLFCNTTTVPEYATFDSYLIEPTGGFNGWISRFRSYELSEEDYNNQDWHEGLVHFDYTKHDTWYKNVEGAANPDNARWAANFGNNRESFMLADGTQIMAMRMANERNCYFNQDQLPLSNERIEWSLAIAIPSGSAMDIRGNFGSIGADGNLTNSSILSMANFEDGTIYCGSEAGRYTPGELIQIELVMELGLRTYTAVVRNQAGQTIANTTQELPAGAINKIDLMLTNRSYVADFRLNARKGSAAEPADDDTFLIADFLDTVTCYTWGQGPGNDELPTIHFDRGEYISDVGYEVDYATDTGGSYMSKRTSDFYGLNFDDYDALRISFTLTVNNGQANIDNYFTVVLSTGREAGYFETYKQNECLTYEIYMGDQPLNQQVELTLPLSEFTTQFDGMSGGVQGTADGTTPLSDIRSISILGASMAKSEVGGVGSGPDVWAIANGNWATAQSCGLRLHKIDLVKEKTGADLISDALDAHMAQYTDGLVSDASIELPASLEVSNADGTASGTIAWSSDHPEIIETDGTVTQPYYDTAVTLTADITAGDDTTASVQYTVSVAGTEGAPTAYDIYTAEGEAFDDLGTAATVHGAVTLLTVPADTTVYKMTALYNSAGLLVDFAVEEGTVGKGYVETPALEYDPAVHDKIAVYIWDTGNSPIVSKLVKEQ